MEKVEDLLTLLTEPYTPENEKYNYLFNSYYQDVGTPWPRKQRGNVSRPTVDEVYDFRRYIDEFMLDLIDSPLHNDDIQTLTVLGGNHEQQHQELILTDIKYNLSINPLCIQKHQVKIKKSLRYLT